MSSKRLQQFLDAIATFPTRKAGITRHVTEDNGQIHLYFELDEHAGTVAIRRDAIPWMIDLRNTLLQIQPPAPFMVLAEWNDAIKEKRLTHEQAAARMNQIICKAITDYADEPDTMRHRRQHAGLYLTLWGYKEKAASALIAEALRNLDEGESAFERPPITAARIRSTLKYWKAEQKRKRIKI